MYCSVSCLIGIVAFIVPIIKSENIESNIREYFKSDIVNSFRTIWKKQQKSFENAIIMAIQDNYGRRGMNVYIRRTNEALQLAKGYYHTDNQVHLILADVKLDSIPILWFPLVNLDLADNIIKIKSNLNKMIINSNYVIFRNKSDIIYELKDQDPYKNSPFRFEQVKNSGELAITVDSCVMTGTAVTKLNAPSANLGHSNFGLSNCRYTLEISSPGMGLSPVIVKYNFNGDDFNIEHLLMKSLRNELLPKLQAALFSIVNTSDIFGEDISKIRHKQENIFQSTSKYINDIVRKMNKITIDRNLNIAKLEDFQITWNDGLNDQKQDRTIRLTKMVMSGLETAYIAHLGGPYRLNSVGLMEEIRFSSIQVRGYIIYEGPTKSNDVFAVEIKDIAVNFNRNITNNNYEFEVTAWREFQVIAARLAFSSSNELITGYLLKAVPKEIVAHLSNLFKEAVKYNEANLDSQHSGSDREDKLKGHENNIQEPDEREDKNDHSNENQEQGTEDEKQSDEKISEQDNKLGEKFFPDPFFANNTGDLSEANKDIKNENQVSNTDDDKEDDAEKSKQPDKKLETSKYDLNNQDQGTSQKEDNQDDNELSDHSDTGSKFFREPFLGNNASNLSGGHESSDNAQASDTDKNQKIETDVQEDDSNIPHRSSEHFFGQPLLAKNKMKNKDLSSDSSSSGFSSSSESDSDSDSS